MRRRDERKGEKERGGYRCIYEMGRTAFVSLLLLKGPTTAIDK